ncbi:M23 family metallopeptidase [Jidongwangia harbinensis]|uniref:M23 family metallopeptidase n=1 Tax=Jidongwangia harbinensis TaxID=2878561 RepID=UPI001CD9A691|nr:M23 family metallopeptidase [Jidongwangia harbinensis]MCA2215968.1 M23 family metallopeptidase [Jidongwangia harbinensis]
MPSRQLTPVRRRVVAAVLGLGVVAVVVLLVGVYAVPVLRPPGPRPAFQLPVACGEKWQVGTYPGHDDFDIDLFPDKGQAWGRPVLAAAAGTVVEAGISGTLGGRTPQNPDGPRGTSGGYWVKIDHGGKWETLYLHMLEPPSVRRGQRVEQGDQIGKVGSTGKSGAPHLHHEQLRAGEKVETHFAGAPSGITTDDREYSVTLTSRNCAGAASRATAGKRNAGEKSGPVG